MPFDLAKPIRVKNITASAKNTFYSTYQFNTVQKISRVVMNTVSMALSVIARVIA